MIATYHITFTYRIGHPLVHVFYGVTYYYVVVVFFRSHVDLLSIMSF